MENGALCLVCTKSVSVFKDYNLKRYYSQKHSAEMNSCQNILKKRKNLELKKNALRLNNLILKNYFRIPLGSNTKYIVASLITKKSKLFIDGEFIKVCLISLTNMYSDKKTDVSKISLSYKAVGGRIEKFRKPVENKIVGKYKLLNIML